MKNNVITVLLYGKEICRIQWQGGYRKGFGKVGSLVSFNPEYRTFGFDVDPLGPYSLSTYLVQKGMSDICRQGEYEGLPRFLSGSLPDDWGNQVFSSWVESAGIRSHEITSVDKLAFIGKRGMGGFEFIPQMYTPASDDAVRLEELYALAKEIEASREGTAMNLQNNPGINDLMSVGMSAGGKHPKAIIAIDWSTGEIRSGQILLPESFTQYILKFKDSETWPTAEIEYVYYQMATECGIDMEKSSLLHVSGANHFLTERFDRKHGRKQHSATLRSLCGEITSYDDIFRACRLLRLPYRDMEQLFRRAVFNYLAGVTDDHDKNFSFMMSENGTWKLSPAYDVTFTVNYKNRFIGDRHAMSVEENDRLLTRRQLLRLAMENDIRQPDEIIREISSVLHTYVSKAEEAGIPDFHKDLIWEFIKKQIENL
jgi:serine/threonine-protein kinase HipA